MQDHALDDVVGRVRDSNHVRTGLRAGTLEKFVSESAGARLHRATRHRALPAFDQHVDAEPSTQRTNMFGRATGLRLERVVVMSRHHRMAFFLECDQQRCAVGSS